MLYIKLWKRFFFLFSNSRKTQKKGDTIKFALLHVCFWCFAINRLNWISYLIHLFMLQKYFRVRDWSRLWMSLYYVRVAYYYRIVSNFLNIDSQAEFFFFFFYFSSLMLFCLIIIRRRTRISSDDGLIREKISPLSLIILSSIIFLGRNYCCWSTE